MFLLAMSELQSSTIKSKAILENIAEGFVVVDKKKRIVAINQAAQEMLGVTEKKAKGKHQKLRKKQEKTSIQKQEVKKESRSHKETRS